MNFKSGMLKLPRGSVCHAEYADGKIRLLVKSGGAVRETEIDPVTKAVTDKGTVSLGEECLLTRSGRIEKIGGGLYYGDYL